MIKKYCDKHNSLVKFRINPSHVPVNDLWDSMKNNKKADGTRRVTETLRDSIETQRTLVLNPFVHFDITRPQFRAELIKTIALVKHLRTELTNP